MSAPDAQAANNTQTIARNSFWYGFEIFFGLFVTLFTSILVARKIGPERLGHFQYVMLLTAFSSVFADMGLGQTTRKYMAEYLNRGQSGIARSVYGCALGIQGLIAVLATGIGVVAVLAAGAPEQRAVSLLLVFAMGPRMLSSIPSQANNAAEKMKRNTGPALLGGAINAGVTLIGLRLGWDLYGLAAGFLLGTAIDTLLKLIIVRRWMRPLAREPIPTELRRRMFSYSGQAMALMALNLVVWDRSDLIILKWMNPDIAQVTFFSITFGLTDKLLMLPQIFSGPMGVTMMAQYGRSEERLPQIAVAGAKYAFLMALPLLAGMACISRPFILAAYQSRFEPMIPVLAIACGFAIGKAIVQPATLLLMTVDKQAFLVWTGCACGAVDIALDFLLTPAYGAAGAATANGVAQLLAAIAIWWRVTREYRVDVRLAEFARIGLSGGLMAAATLAVQYAVPVSGYARVGLAVAAGAVVWFAALRLTGALNSTDAERIRHVSGRLPQSLRPAFERSLALLCPRSAAGLV